MIRIDALHRTRHPGAHRRFGGGFGIAHDSGNHVAQGLSIAQAKHVRRHEALPDGDVLLARTLTGPDENISQQLDSVEFVYAEHGIHRDLL